MQPFRKNVALAIDGGGIKGVIVTRALAMVEKELKRPLASIVRLSAGTSTGSIISAGLACGLTATQMLNLYIELGNTIFRKTWRTTFFPFTRYRYEGKPLLNALNRYLGHRTVGDLWQKEPRVDLVLPTFDVVANKTRFIKPWKDEYRKWPLAQAVMASSSVPTYFPVVAGRFVDGGVGSYANPCYLAAYEAQYCLNWDPAETTLISLGTGRSPHAIEPNQASGWFAWDWIFPMLSAFLQSADDQQFGLTASFFKDLDFRRFQVDLMEPIEMDSARQIAALERYGDEMGKKILHDQVDTPPNFNLTAQPALI
jgi:uncharacterized protein